MNIMLGLFNLGGGEIILILAIILILFGAKKLPELAKGLGQGIKEFKKATQSASEGLREAMAESPSTAPRPLAPPTIASVEPENCPKHSGRPCRDQGSEFLTSQSVNRTRESQQ